MSNKIRNKMVDALKASTVRKPSTKTTNKVVMSDLIDHELIEKVARLKSRDGNDRYKVEAGGILYQTFNAVRELSHRYLYIDDNELNHYLCNDLLNGYHLNDALIRCMAAYAEFWYSKEKNGLNLEIDHYGAEYEGIKLYRGREIVMYISPATLSAFVKTNLFSQDGKVEVLRPNKADATRAHFLKNMIAIGKAAVYGWIRPKTVHGIVKRPLPLKERF